jgi:hypothetical protein
VPRVVHLLLHDLLDLVGHGMKLPPAGARGDDEVVERVGDLPQVEHVHVGAAGLVGHAGGGERAGAG